MTWVRFDDQFPIHRKVAGLDDATYRLHTEAIFWCARNGTDGVIRKHELTLLGARAKPTRVTKLVDQEVWHRAGELCDACKTALAKAGTDEPDDGWVLHDFLDFQPSRAKVANERAGKADRQARWVAAKQGGRHSAGASKDASHNASQDAAPYARAPGRDRSRAGAPETPPRPAPKEAGRSPEGSGRRLASPGGDGGRKDENPDWRTLPAIGTPRDQADVDRARRGAAAARDLLARPHNEEAS